MLKLKEKQNEIEGGSDRGGAPLRILLVAPSLDILGGQAIQAARLLVRLGNEPSLEVGFQPINPRLPAPFDRLQAIKYVRTVVTSLLYIGQLLARVPAYDVIHVFSASYLSFVLAPTPAVLIAKLFGKRVALNYRSGEADDHLRRWRHTALPVLRLADILVVPSGYLVDVFARFGLCARAIHNIVETDQFRFRLRSPLRPVFLANRNLEPLYNVGCVLRAFALIQRRHPDARLTVAGDGSQRAELERLARELGLRYTEFVGRVAPARMPELYDNADVLLNAPNIDNMPHSILEAYSAGLPVVTTDAGGIPYIVEDGRTGLIVPRGDEGALARATLRLFVEPKLASELAAAAHAECRHYSWEAVRGDWRRLYCELVGAPVERVG